MEKQKFTIGVDKDGKVNFEKVEIDKTEETIEIKMSEILIKYPIELKEIIDKSLEFTGDYAIDGSPIYKIILPEGFKIVYKN